MSEQLSFSTDDRGNRERVLEALREFHGQWVKASWLAKVGGSRYGARVHELRELGWLIDCQGEAGRFVYRLVGRGQPKARRLTARQVAKLLGAWRAAA